MTWPFNDTSFREEIFKNINFGSQTFSQHNSSLSNMTFTLILKRLFQIRKLNSIERSGKC